MKTKFFNPYKLRAYLLRRYSLLPLLKFFNPYKLRAYLFLYITIICIYNKKQICLIKKYFNLFIKPQNILIFCRFTL